MTIAFVCSCGKRLKARDEQAGRLTVCPRCGESVGVPPPRRADEPAPLTPQERRRLARQHGETPDAEAATVPAKIDASRAALASLARDLKVPTPRSARRRRRPLETRWYQCLVFPLYEIPYWIGPALALTLAAGLTSLFAADWTAAAAPAPVVSGLVVVASSLAALFFLGYPCNYLGGVLADAAAGGGSDAWKGHSPSAVLRAGLAGVVCFLAGPIVPTAAAVHFWLSAGALAGIDGFLALEMGICAVGLFLLTAASVAERGRLRDVLPFAVADLAYRLGARAALAALIGAALVGGLAVLLSAGLAELHRKAAFGWLLLIAFGSGGMYGGAVLFRLLGLWCHRTRPAHRP